jgi:hypothetical protein
MIPISVIRSRGFQASLVLLDEQWAERLLPADAARVFQRSCSGGCLQFGPPGVSPLVGWLSALITAVAPRSVFYGQEVNQYALVLLLAVLYPLLLERYLRRPSLV